jgi:hypothetical protein
LLKYSTLFNNRVPYQLNNSPSTNLTVALGTTECTAEAGGTIAAGDQLEYNPTGDVLIAWGGTNTVVGRALTPATVGQTFLYTVSTANN